MAQQLIPPKVQFFDTSTGTFLAGGKLCSYEVDSMTPKATYPTNADAIAGTNPNDLEITLDSRGEAVVWFNGSIKFILKDANGNVIWTEDNIGQTNVNILDDNGNELVIFVTTNNAVNEITVTNAVTGQQPIIQSSGGDTNVGLKVTTKGSGPLYLDGGSTGTVEIANTSTGNVNIHQNTNLTGTLAATQDVTTHGLKLLPFPIGFVFPYLGSVAPPGCLSLDGSAVSRTTYSDLYTICGTTFGTGDGSTTFNLPDLRRRTIVGLGGSGSSTLAATRGSTGGEEAHTMTLGELVAHTHTYTNHTTSAASGGGVTVNDSGGTGATGSTGSTTPFNVMQPSIVLMYCVVATYSVAPTAASISPGSGTSAGGTSLAITGTNFVYGATTVTIGDNTVAAGSVTVASPTSLSFNSPAHAAGAVSVTVTTAFGTTSAIAGGYTYT